MVLIPYIDIKPNFPTNDFSNTIKNTIGKIKYELDINAIIDKLYKNQDFVDYINLSKYSFLPLDKDYYSKDVAKYFDIYGGSYNIICDDIEYIIKIYCYKIKQNELISKEIINKFKLIFQYDYFVKNNILNMIWHNYCLNINFIDNLKQNRFNIPYQFNNIKLFNHQRNNISRMLNIHKNPTVISISDHMPIYFDNDIIYDMCTNDFIEQSNIPTFNITSGMIIDEPGTGKTLQFIIYSLEIKLNTNNVLNTLVLVPNDAIKDGWIAEYKKYITGPINFDILTFNELEILLGKNDTFLNQYEIIGIDEIHNLYRGLKTNLLDKIISSSIKYRWGITGTPFVSDISFFHIIKFLTGYNFKNERIANNPFIQTQFINLFFKNCKIDMIEYEWPELNIHDVKVKLDIVQQNLYNTEKMLNKGSYNLRKLICDINLMFNDSIINTPTELKQYGISHYKKLYENEKLKLDKLKEQQVNIINNEKDFEQLEYLKRIEHFKFLIEKQQINVETHRKASEYFLNSIEEINKIMINQDNEDSDEYCKICWNNYSIPITYIKTCGHYYCKACIKQWNKAECPLCRKHFTNDDIINVNNVYDINNSSKVHEILKIINDDESKYIIFTQFNIVINKIKQVLANNNIISTTLNDYTDEKVLLLSSEQNAEGINLSRFDKIIIFEPFENNMYNNQVEKQLIARIHRIGRDKPVDVYRFITEGTIEEEIYK